VYRVSGGRRSRVCGLLNNPVNLGHQSLILAIRGLEMQFVDDSLSFSTVQAAVKNAVGSSASEANKN
jgi:hypothetical protein